MRRARSNQISVKRAERKQCNTAEDCISDLQQHVMAAVAFLLGKVLKWKMCAAILHFSVVADDGKVWPGLHLPQVKATKVPDTPFNMRELLLCTAASERPQTVWVRVVR